MSENPENQSNIWQKALEVLNLQVLAIIRESQFYHQSEKNISACGSSIENFVQDFLKTILPSRFCVKSGYIVAPNGNSPIMSPHMDIVITDSLVPDSLLPFTASPGLFLIPYEAVVGIVEIKRTLTQKSIVEASNHLQKCNFIFEVGNEIDSIAIGGLRSPNIIGYKWNPFLSIISVHNELTADHEKNVADKLILQKNSQISFVASLDGFYLGVTKDGNPTVIEDRQQTYLYRKSEGELAIKCLLKYIYFHLRQTAGAWADFNKYW